MRRLLLPLVLLVASAAAAAAQQPYVDPALRHLLRPDARATVEQALEGDPLSPPSPAAAGNLALDREGPAGTARVGVFVKLRTPAALAELRAAGAEIGTVAGDIATARVPLGALARVAGLGTLQRIEAAQVVERVNDRATAVVRADPIRSLVGGSWQGFAGQGVIVAVYDSGLDFQHEDFRDAEGQTRLLGLWDQTLGGTPPPGFGYGVLCGVPSLNDGTCPQRDNDGHGTHVAGSAAGNGFAIPGPGFAGVAPAADILVVKGGDRSFAEDRIIDGVAWAFAEATRLQRPVVVNLSLGGQFGAHDGTRLYEQAIDNLSGPGRVVVTSSGNDGASPSGGGIRRLIHATGVPAAGATQSFTILVPEYSPVSEVRGNNLRIHFWYGGTDQLTIRVVRPDGTAVSATYGQSIQNLSPSGGVFIDNVSDRQRDPENGDHEAIILIENLSGSGPPAQGTWTIEVVPQVLGAARRYHFWMYSNSIRAAGQQGFTNSHLVGSPATSRRAVAVGAFVTRQTWLSVDGREYGFDAQENREAVGDIAQFSSVGPTRDGRLKPEITAPGKTILSSLSRFASPTTPLITTGGRHLALQGTSMSAPMVTGGIAILLQRAPSLTPEQVKEIFAATSIRDGFTARSFVPGDPGGNPNFTWGWGKLNVEAGAEAAGAFAQFSVLAVAVAPAAPPPAAPLTRAGTRIPLLRLDLTADGPEALDVTALGFRAAGIDPGARLLLFRDAERDGQLGAQDPLLGSVPLPLLEGDTASATIPLELRIPAGQTVTVLAVLELSGAAPNRTPFRGFFVPAATRAVAAETGAPRTLRQPGGLVASAVVQPTLLQPGELFALSENPVHGSTLILNFATLPTTARIFTASGRLVTDLRSRIDDRARVEWDLTNDAGAPIAPGVYLLVLRIGDETIRERLIVTRRAGGAP